MTSAVTSRDIAVIVHQETSNPGQIGAILTEFGYSLDIRCPAIGDRLPSDLARYAGFVVFGGPMSANDTATLPFLQAELNWIERAVQTGKPYLGICLGAQLLARALGATVSPHDDQLREIGYHPIQFTSGLAERGEGRSLHVYQWHSEGFELPDGATLLATGDTFPHQAFRYEAAYGLQFHPEITAEMIDFWTTNGGDQLTLPGARPRSLHFADHDRYGYQVEQWLRSFLRRWLAAEVAQWPGLRQSA